MELNIARKAPKAVPFTRELILRTNIHILRDPQISEILDHQDWTSHTADVPILAVAARARVDFLTTLNTEHSIDDPDVPRCSGLRIGTPGDALAWAREQLSKLTK